MKFLIIEPFPLSILVPLMPKYLLEDPVFIHPEPELLSHIKGAKLFGYIYIKYVQKLKKTMYQIIEISFHTIKNLSDLFFMFPILFLGHMSLSGLQLPYILFILFPLSYTRCQELLGLHVYQACMKVNILCAKQVRYHSTLFNIYYF